MTTPQPMTVRRGGTKRGDHGSFIAPVAPPAAETPSDTIGAGSVRAGASRTRRAVERGSASATTMDATARAKAAYDAKPKVIFRGVDEEIADKLKAIYKAQLHSPEGIEGWSEWGRTVLADFVADYERRHGPVSGGEAVALRAGRVVKS